MDIEVRELGPGQAHVAADALLALRPQYGDTGALVRRIEAQLTDGFRLAGAFLPGEENAGAAMGFRISENLAWGRFLYVDDLSTLPSYRGRGLARALLVHAGAVARAAGCGELHLDSGTQVERAAAHTLYFTSGMRISSYHFQKSLAD